MRLNVHVEDSLVQTMLLKQKLKLKNLTPAMQAASIALHRVVMDNFKAEGRPTRWPDLSPVTKAIKRKEHGTLPPILVDSGTLRRSVHNTFSSTEARVSTSVTYAKKHQLGSGNVPARPFMVLPSSDVPKLVEIVRRYLK